MNRIDLRWCGFLLLPAVALGISISACNGGAAPSAAQAPLISNAMAVFVASDPQFNAPHSVAVDGDGNVYVADAGNSTIRKITPAGVVSTLAGMAGVPGSADGTGAAARFNVPLGVTVDLSGNVYVADTYNSTIRRITTGGLVTTFAGLAGVPGSADGTGAAARLNRPIGIAMDGAGNVYVGDSSNSTIRKITPEGVVSTLAGTPGVPGSVDGTGAAARFNGPQGVAVDDAGNVYVADASNHTIRKITPDAVVSTLAGTPGVQGDADGTGAAAEFRYPLDVAVDGAGNVYVAGYLSMTIRKISPAGEVTTFAGSTRNHGSADGTGTAALFWCPTGVEVDGSGIVYVADSNNVTIRKITPTAVVSTIAGTAGVVGSADGTVGASFAWPSGVAVDGAGNAYVADPYTSTIKKITPTGVVSTLAGTARVVGSADGTGTAALFNYPCGLAVDASGNVYVADTYNFTIRKITPTGVVSTLAGTAGYAGSADGAGAEARFYLPYGITADASGNVYVADTYNFTVRKITPAGVVSTLAGTAGVVGSADGTGADARFNYPYDVAVDAKGRVFVADTYNFTIRRINARGAVSTLAGTPGLSGGADGTDADARFFNPQGVVVDGSGNVYVADTGNSTIRKVTSKGVVSTVVGVQGQTANVPGPLPASIAPPSDVAIDPTTAGRIIITNVAGVMEVGF